MHDAELRRYRLPSCGNHCRRAGPQTGFARPRRRRRARRARPWRRWRRRRGRPLRRGAGTSRYRCATSAEGSAPSASPPEPAHRARSVATPRAASAAAAFAASTSRLHRKTESAAPSSSAHRRRLPPQRDGLVDGFGVSILVLVERLVELGDDDPTVRSRRRRRAAARPRLAPPPVRAPPTSTTSKSIPKAARVRDAAAHAHAQDIVAGRHARREDARGGVEEAARRRLGQVHRRAARGGARRPASAPTAATSSSSRRAPSRRRPSPRRGAPARARCSAARRTRSRAAPSPASPRAACGTGGSARRRRGRTRFFAAAVPPYSSCSCRKSVDLPQSPAPRSSTRGSPLSPDGASSSVDSRSARRHPRWDAEVPGWSPGASGSTASAG